MRDRGRRLRWGVVAVLSLALASALIWLVRAKWIERGTDRARRAYARGDWDATAALATTRLRAVPGDRTALRLLARAEARRGRDERARALYARLGGASALQAEDFFLLGKAIDRTRDRQTARSCWVAGLQADPRNAELLNEFVRLYREGGQLDLAEPAAVALAKQPGWEARGALHLGQIALERDEPENAARYFERAFERDPALHGASDSAQAVQTRLVRALLRAGRADEAAARLRSALAARPDPENAWLLSRAELQAGRPASAVTWLKQSGSYRADHPLEREPAPYIGAERCGACHGEQYQAEQQSLHARTFQRSPVIAGLPQGGRGVADPGDPAVTHTIEVRGGHVRYAAKDAGRTLAAIVAYAFGSGHRGMTLIGRDEAGRMRELRLSHYADGPCWDVTTGHPAVPPREEGFLGRILSPTDLESCFECHTTTPYPALDDRGPTAHDRGIGCERCHGPGGNHVAAVRANGGDLAIVQPRAAAGAGVVALCGQCHAPLRRTVRRDDPTAPRFPAAGLTWSRCYEESHGALDCRTCHDPHVLPASSQAQYEKTCRGCHAEKAASSVCPINSRSGCISCHMPKTKIGVPHAEFTDHHIRVHDKNGHHEGPPAERSQAGPHDERRLPREGVLR